MQTRRITRWAAVGALAALALAVAACSGSSSDKAGGAEEQEPVVLTFASFTDDIQPQLRVFAEEVVRRSDGTLRIEFKPAWRPGDPDAERGTIEDVKAGKADMAWVGARVFDTARREELPGPPCSAPRRQLRARGPRVRERDPHEHARGRR